MHFVFLIVIFLCNTNSQTDDLRQRELQQVDYAVYSAALNQLYAGDKIKLIVIVNRTEQKLLVKPLFKLEKRYLLKDKTGLSSLLYSEDKEAFSKTYPDSPGYIMLSEVQYDETATEATLRIDQECGFLCGIGWYLKLSKRDGKWIVQTKEVTWQK